MQIVQTKIFSDWFCSLKDQKARHIITARLERLSFGLTGDAHSLGQGLSELRINFGPGYRIYYTVRKQEIYVLLSGGDKASQSRDIQKARKLMEELL